MEIDGSEMSDFVLNRITFCENIAVVGQDVFVKTNGMLSSVINSTSFNLNPAASLAN